ncbi:DUF3021 domain-containing protein [Bifidobacterium choerinum]|uniref:DUF3021 domain-containing protein n=1 Tax=Bifidobacterium choerinum TaxID=35760 RepID=A0A087AGM4_9BIFI|nr:DUF3021 domain-containing protein [Bifidobacterium choerinum]ATU19932.1 hypothetical protein BcFMB_02205 [Bifidobacterium choerinum]KFI57924.1 hypothetical protein BCHO_0004 [Bifidobacterium choerinum]
MTTTTNNSTNNGTNTAVVGKAMAKYTAVGIGIAAFIAMTFAAITGLIIGGETGALLVKQFVAMLVIGVAYGAPAVVWLSDRLAKWAQMLIALAPGTVVYMLIAWWIGWIPRQYGLWAVVSVVVFILVFTAIISAICGVVFRSDVRRMNAQLKRRRSRQ